MNWNTLKNISFTKTLFFNIKYFGKDFYRLPVYIGRNVLLEKTNGQVKISEPLKKGMIRIGFDNNSVQDKKFQRTIWNISGIVFFEGTATIGCGAKIYCKTGTLKFGKFFSINGDSEIICTNSISFGDSCNISWDCLFMDSDFHSIKWCRGG